MQAGGHENRLQQHIQFSEFVAQIKEALQQIPKLTAQEITCTNLLHHGWENIAYKVEIEYDDNHGFCWMCSKEEPIDIQGFIASLKENFVLYQQEIKKNG